MFENMQALWQLMQAGATSPDSTAAAAQLAQLGDPDTLMKPLFSDAQQWNPTNFGQDMQVPQQSNPMGGFAGMMTPMQPSPGQQINLGNSAQMMDGTQRQLQQQTQQQTQQGLTAEQYKQLMGMMPDQKGYVPPAPGVTAPRGLSGNMQMLEAGQRQPQRRATLGDLIYGGR